MLDDTDAQTDLIVTDEGSASDESDGGSSQSEAEASPDPIDRTDDPNAVTIVLNGEQVAARKGEMVIAAALRDDEYIPHFCYHPRMSPVGMCRQCMVEVEGPRGPMMVVSCMTPVADGQVVNTATDGVKRAQEGMLEMLLANHPLDCPVCDKGGECPLQDQAFSHGPGESRFVEEKRHYEKPIPISDLVFLDRERCILCDRCTRFADEVAGDKLIHFISRGNNTQVMTFPDEPFASYFSGNTVQICPVGALTAHALPVQGPPVGPVAAGDHVHDVLGRLPHRHPVEPRRSAPRAGRRQRPGQLGLAVRPRPFQLRGQQVRPAPRASRSSAASPACRPRRGTPPSMPRVGSSARRSTPAGRLASPCSVAPADRTRTRSPGHSSPTRSASSTATPSSATGCPAEVLGLPRATIADAAAASTIILLGPDLKEELPVLFLRLRDAAEKKGTQDRRVHLGRVRAVEIRLEVGALRTRHVEHRVSTGAGRCRDRRAVGERTRRRSSLGRQNLAVPAGRDSRRAADAPRRRSRKPPSCPRCVAGTSSAHLSVGLAPADADHDGLATLQAAADGKIDLLRARRRRSDQRLSRRRPRRAAPSPAPAG